MSTYSNRELQEGISAQNPKVLKHLYKVYFPRVKGMVINMGGDEEDVDDIFQEGVIILYRRLKKMNGYEPGLMVENYLVGTCRIVWTKQYNEKLKRQRNETSYHIREDEFTPDTESNIINDYKESLRKNLYQKHFDILKKDCQEILIAFYSGKPTTKIIKELKMSSIEYLHRRKYLCKEYLVKSIKSDPLYKELMDEDEDDE